jgi:DNA-binding CsgD family transcriptional regulator
MFVDRNYLEHRIAAGLSLQEMGVEAGCHPTTVAYWCRKYGLKTANSDRFAPKGGLERDQLVQLVEAGLTLREIAERLNRSISTILALDASIPTKDDPRRTVVAA